jgi:hypothetical protein
MYEFPDIMEKYRAIPKDHPNRKYEIVKLCLEKYQYMLDRGGMDYRLKSDACPACQEWYFRSDDIFCLAIDCSGCLLFQAGERCESFEGFERIDSPWWRMIVARKDNNQEAFTQQVKWFCNFFEKWLKDNPE